MTTDRVLIYCRQSLGREDEDESSSLSLDMQERECRMLATSHDWTVIEPVIRDHDVKGHDPTRPGIAEMFQRIESERADVVIVYALSRFARDYILQETLWRRLHAQNVRLVSVKEPHAEDELMRGLLGVLDQYDRRKLGMFLSSAFRERARRGLPHGKTPYGFRKTETGHLEIDEDARPWVLDIAARLDEGWSLWKIARYLNDNQVDGRTWEPNVVRNTIKTPAIAGGVKCADVLTWESHEPIINRDRWERLCALLESRRPIRTKRSSSWLEGLIICGCGAPMHLVADTFHYDPPRGQFRCSANPNLQPFQRPKRYPPCTYRPRSIMASVAEQQTISLLVTALQTLLAPNEVYRSAQAHFERLERSEGKRLRDLERQLARTEQERERLLVLYRRGTLDVERWETQDVELAGRIAALTATLAGLESPPDRTRIETQHSQLVNARDALTVALAVDPSQSRRILASLDLRVQRSADGVVLLWPDHLAPFVSAIA